ncbi:MAG: hypothetical protein HDR88_06750 [Bacteroides sp.]|nr:hypothetical protein [Bacteroides sp.]
METKRHFLRLALATVMTAFFAACSSTEVIDPPKEHEKIGETITLTIAQPDLPSGTRADNTHLLRYTVVAYNGDISITSGNQVINFSEPLERQEIIASDDTNSVTFQVEPGTYSFIIIGDYIPNDAKYDSNTKHYEDKYYNTSLDDGKIYMRSFYDFKTNSDKDSMRTCCINEDHYECFAETIVIKKEEEEVIKDVTLQRIVSKISFVSTTAAPANIEEIKFSSIDYLCHYDFLSKTAGTQASNKVTSTVLKWNNYYAQSNKPNEVLFYFYSLANPNTTSTTSLGEIGFQFHFEDGTTSKEHTIKDRTIIPIANYKITVKGALLSDPIPIKGPITLNLSTDNDWTDSEINP